ncbi:hypothetical protein HO133_004169 [Letharia lupina]|uniref:chitinase n=1 Tax=Letharia lupina TaxID=560253 RepID=A0A8H6CA68_9LECA|nr:uncharacterized protein HO133_004169 [Letharia lupina]KAF6219700.1 hypothetical protein HO133_004169 [Letharia lupina]
MFYSSTPILALGAISLLASAGHAEANRREPQIHNSRRQAPAGFVEVPLAELQMLQSEYSTFHGWMTAYLSSANSTDPQTAQLNQDVLAYDMWINIFLSKYANSTNAPAAALTPAAAATPAASSTAAAPYAVVANSSTNGSFSAQSSSNLAVYYGQSPATDQFTLEQMCQDQNVDIVVLAFLTTFFGPAGQPVINFGPATGGTPTLGAQKINATGLLDCPYLAKNITTCQSLGKKVLLSLGGAAGVTNFTSDAQATSFATDLWNLFGGGMTNSDLRPFGSVKVDGFDVDNEDHSTKYYDTFVSSLRNTYAGDKSKQYYISGAPQCPRPDASIPLGSMQTMDFVFVQFYNNAAAGCDIGQPGFVDSFKAWSSDLSGNGTVAGGGPKLYIGAPACEACAGKGYLEPANMTSVIKSAMMAGVKNFGGVMLWDGSEAKNNTGVEGDYLQVVKSALD